MITKLRLLLCLLAGLSGLSARADSFKTLYRFDIPPNQPRAGLVMGTNGEFFGTTKFGGTFDVGGIYKISTNGVVSIVRSFTGVPDGSFPEAGLVAANDGAMYGVSSLGGTNDAGMIFRLTTAGVYTPLYSLEYFDGQRPLAPLIQAADGALYGTASNGGTNGFGAVFKMTTGGVFNRIWSFTAGADGSHPAAGLVQGADNALYGVCSVGGSNLLGTAFRMTTSGAITPLWSFTGGADGKLPNGTLAAGTNGAFMGVTTQGGTNFYGTAFKITTNGVMTPLWSFKYTGTDGGYPYSGMTRASNGLFYGPTQYGGPTSQGTIYKLSQDGGMTLLASFTFNQEGGQPGAPLFLAPNGVFHGTAELGGSNNVGTVFTFTETGGLKKAWAFQAATNGHRPYAGLVRASDGSFYGTASAGGTNNQGTFFKLGTNGVPINLWSFTSDSGSAPQAELLPGSNGMFFGTTYGGGANYGTVYSVTTNGTFQLIYAFQAGQDDAAYPQGGVTWGPDRALYGATAYGGSNDVGAFYRVTTDGTATVLHHFSETEGKNPWGTPATDGIGNFYGNTKYGGSNDMGTVYRISTNGQFTTLHYFTGFPDDGESPNGGLIFASDGALYGTTYYGGTNGVGTIFRITTNGNETVVVSILDTSPGGGYPEAPLIQGSDGALYGTTTDGGDNGFGAIFRVTTGGQFDPLVSFTGGTNGGDCRGSLVQATNQWLYGTTILGGGTIFRLALIPILDQQRLANGKRVLTWFDSTYFLESTTNTLDVYTNIAGAVSPYTNNFTDPLRFFRLRTTNGP